jgi:hypothetical protein
LSAYLRRTTLADKIVSKKWPINGRRKIKRFLAPGVRKILFTEATPTFVSLKVVVPFF